VLALGHLADLDGVFGWLGHRPLALAASTCALWVVL
jgi:hypothetical protein